MFGKLEIFSMANGLAAHAAARHSVIAQNVANADTPGFRAQDIASFAESYRSGQPEQSMRATRGRHLVHTHGQAGPLVTHEVDNPTSPNGNSVSLEAEMVNASDVRHQHELALSIYSTSLDILRTSLGRR